MNILRFIKENPTELRKWLAKSKIKQDTLAQETGIAPKRLKKWLRGQQEINAFEQAKLWKWLVIYLDV